MLNKVISGGQTGVDIAGLRAAKEVGLETGGWMPKNFTTTDGPMPEWAEEFGLQEHTSRRYPPRTYQNVEDAHGTIRLAFKFGTPGERCTYKAIKCYEKPYINVDLDDPCPINDVLEWLHANSIETLNVAGNSEKTHPGVEKVAYDYLIALFRAALNNGSPISRRQQSQDINL